jgi:transcriptional regulator
MNPAKPPPFPKERSETIRVSLRRALERGWVTAHELSADVGLREKDVAAHLSHIERSLKKDGGQFEVDPAGCLECEFIFKKRDRLTRPARCPVCNSERISPPRFRILLP